MRSEPRGWWLALALAGCGAQQAEPAQPPSTSPATQVPVAETSAPAPAASGADPVTVVSDAPRIAAPSASATNRDFPASPITAMADGVAAVVRAALAGDPLPDTPVPHEGLRPGRPIVLPEQHGLAGKDLRFEFMFLETNVIVDDDPNAQDGRLRTGLFLSRGGVKLVFPRLGGPGQGKPMPAWASGVDAVVRQALRDLVQGKDDQVFLGPVEKQVLQEPELWKELTKERSKPKRQQQLKQLLQGHATPLGYDLDDIVLGARVDGDWVLFKLEFEHDSQGLRLDSAPVVRVRRMSDLRAQAAPPSAPPVP